MKYDLVIIGVNYCSSDQTMGWVQSIRMYDLEGVGVVAPSILENGKDIPPISWNG